MGKRIREWLTAPPVLRAIIVINGISFLLGLLWYGPQLQATPWYFWPMVPDCPLAALFVAVALGLHLWGRGRSWMDALAFASAIKYGIWTLVIIGHAWTQGAPVEAMSLLLFVSHVGLLLEGIIYGGIYLRGSLRVLWVPLLWFVLNDSLDYAIGVHPTLPIPSAVELARNLAILTSALGLGFVVGRLHPAGGPKARSSRQGR